MTSYKGFVFNDKKFSEFLSEKIIQPLLQKVPEVTGVRVLFDDKDENSSLFCVFELPDEKQKTFQIRLNKVLGACYSVLQSKKATAEEKACLTFLEEKVRDFI